MSKKRYIFGVFFLICIMLQSCGNDEKDQQKIVRPVKAFQVTQPQSTLMRVFPGITLAANETTLAFQVPGQIIKLPIFEGDQITQGQIIAELDNVKYQESVNELYAKLMRDKGNYDRANILIKSGHISVADYDKVKSAYLMTQANYNSALTDLNNAKLIAPFAGIIAKKFVKNYEYITAKQPIVLLQDKTNIDLEINVPEKDIVNLKSNEMKQRKMFAAFDALPKQNFNIKLKEYSSQADTQTQTFRIVFTMPKPENVNILPGMTVSIHVDMGQKSGENFYVIPSSAVFLDENHIASVWLIDKKTMHVKKRSVKTSTLIGDQIRIFSGLAPNDFIVISGVHYLTESQEVKIQK